MTVSFFEKERQRERIAENLVEFGERGADLNWVSGVRAQTAEAERARLLGVVGDAVTMTHRQSKPHLGPLSPGCRICGEGAWSCLFINGSCNCRCFYCPTAQDDISVPTTNRIPFDEASDYADYVRHFGFTGASISGGEPLMTLGRSLRYIRTLRHRLGPGLHIWLYTNGTLLTAETVSRLKDAGLDEIRFDISAAAYSLKPIGLAAGRIPVVTVEIPAIPEDSESLIKLLPALRDAGVDHLNLHQLRITPHNSANLAARPYTFLHGERVTVLESELTALKLLAAAAVQNIGPPINYCSFVYKYRCQRAAVRGRTAALICKGHEGITENGYIRQLALCGPADQIRRQVDRLVTHGVDPALWSASGKVDRLAFHETQWPMVEDAGCTVTVSYSQAVLQAHVSYRCAFTEVRVGSGMKLFIEKQPVCMARVLGAEAQRLLKGLIRGCPEESGWAENETIAGYECIYPGLQDYY
ncbi:MAG: radical SAM protein [Pseudomonadota bacterium]